MGLIDSPDNGATERPGTSNDSLFVFLAGPIRYWWRDDVEGTSLHKYYTAIRSRVHQELSEWFLVYAPHRAWRGPWNELAQVVNDHAISLAHAIVWLDIPGIPAVGTEKEVGVATNHNVPDFRLVIGMDGEKIASDLLNIVSELKKLDRKRRESYYE